MLAFSVREALRQAAAAFGPPGTSVDLASPATPEAVWWALTEARAGHDDGHLVEGAPGRGPDQPDAAPRPAARSEVEQASAAPGSRRARGPGWTGWRPSSTCGPARAGVLVTVAVVRGHSPRRRGRRWSSGGDGTWASVGGGNLEATAVDRARELLDRPGARALDVRDLSDKARVTHGVQCCGGEVTLLLEPLTVLPAVAIFGSGTSGLELARILARHDLDLHLVDSRSGAARRRAAGRCSRTPSARVHLHHVPVLPELVLAELPPGTHVLVMTHDHAEDAALCDAALRTRAPRPRSA